jgi:hypothetical protein
LLSSIVFASLGNARAKAADAAIIEDLIGIRTSAETYFQENGNNYGNYSEGFCLATSGTQGGVTKLSPDVVKAIQHIKTLNVDEYGASRVWCASDAKSYVVAAKLKHQPDCINVYCVDSKGTAKIVKHQNSAYLILFDSTIGFYCSDSNPQCG